MTGFRAPLTPARRRLLDRLLDELLDLPEAGRRARLQALARSHPRLQRHLARLAAAADPGDEAFATVFERIGAAALSSLENADGETADSTLPSGTRVGDWRLLEAVGRGGMGQVYRAERADGAFEMQVAVKFIRARGRRGLAERLAMERRLLARLDHPNIARLIDGGTLEDGQGYLVMEWIEGRDLSHARDPLLADPTGLIEAFIELAGAVAHAHQRRVVHGDIKPANVRLSPDGRMRLLDFGVARLLSEDDESAGLSALTPAFSAPEQLAGEPASTQSDVYALGALLRWLLTGEPGHPDAPIDASRLTAPRPEALAAILNCAMNADPARRYPSVPELSNDLHALLAWRPVRARRTGAWSRLGLWARRHRLAASLAGLSLASVLVATAGLAWQAERIRDQRDAARFEAERLALLREQMVMLFRTAGQAADSALDDPRQLLGESVSLAERLYADDPETRSAVQAFLGEIYIAMDDFEAAEPLLEAVLASGGVDEDRLTAFVEADLAQIRLRQGRSDDALALAEDALVRLRRQASAANLEYIADVEQIRGQALRGLGRWDDALGALREAHGMARRLPGPSRIRATTANNLATTLIYAGRMAEALPYLERSLANWRGLERADTSAALTVMGNLASLRHQRGDLSDAEALYREVVQRRLERYGESGALAAMHLNLGSLLAQTGRIAEAGEQVREGLAMIERFEGADSINYTRGLLARARVDRIAGRYDRARLEADEAVRRFTEQVGADHLFTALARMDLALTAAEAGRPEGLEQLADAIAALDALAPVADPYRAEARCREAHLRLRDELGGAAEAAGICRDLYEDSLDVSEWRRAEARLLQWRASNPGLTPGADQQSDLERVRAALGPVSDRTRRLETLLETSAAGG